MTRQPVRPQPAASLFGPITLTDIVRYQGASGDMNPSHHDHSFATSNGFRGVFAPGLLSAGLLGDWVTAWLGPTNLRRFGVRFQQQVWLGDVLRCSGSVSEVRDHMDGVEVEVDLVCEREGEAVTTGWATFVLPTP